MNTDENKEDVMLFDNRSRSLDSTTIIMSNTLEARVKKVIQVPTFIGDNNAPSQSNTRKKNRSSVFERLTIVNVETSSSTKKKGVRRKSAPRNHKPLPEELLLRQGHSDCISQIADSFSNSNTFSNDEGDLKAEVPVLFTFDMVPSKSGDSSGNENVPEPTAYANIDDSATANTGHCTTDANIFGEEDDLSGIFDEFEESDEKCIKDLEQKYGSKKKFSTDNNTDSIPSMRKLETNSSSRTESTGLLSQTSSNDLPSPSQKTKTSKTRKPIKTDEKCYDDASLISHEDLYAKASNCISFNFLSMFH